MKRVHLAQQRHSFMSTGNQSRAGLQIVGARRPDETEPPDHFVFSTSDHTASLLASFPCNCSDREKLIRIIKFLQEYVS